MLGEVKSFFQKKWLKSFLIFIIIVVVYRVIGTLFFPVNDKNVLQSPDWYALLSVGSAFLVAYVFYLVQKKKEKRNNNFKVPFFKFQRNRLAADLFLNAKISADKANKARTVSEFIEQYDIVLDSFKKLSDMNGKVTNVKGDLLAEYWRLKSEFQKHLHDAIDRSGDKIIDTQKQFYSHDNNCIKQSILAFKTDIEKYSFRADENNRKFAVEKFRYTCHECGMSDLLPDSVNETYNVKRSSFESDIKCSLEFKSTENKTIHQPDGSPSDLIDKKLNDMGALTLIKGMEDYFESKYRFAYEHSLNVYDRKRLYDKIISDFSKINLPLPVKIRFEQLCEEYKTKFQHLDFMQYVDSLSGVEFEQWCANLLRNMSFQNVEITAGSGDQGVDLLAENGGVKYAIQCKCYSSDLGNTPIQEVEAGRIYYGCHVGVVMTNRYFTIGAKKLANKTGTLLWDRDFLNQAVNQ